MRPLTDRQSQVLDFIRQYISAGGYPPTLREIASSFSLSGPRAAVKHLDALERKGYISRERGLSRSIDVKDRSAGNIGEFKPGRERLAVPLLGNVPAGPPELAVEDPISTLVLDDSIAGEGTFLLRVQGQSMTGENIVPGDLVVVRPQASAENGEMVVVMVGEEATLKRYRRKGNKVHLLPSNPDYATIVLDEDSGNARIAGKVKAVIRVMGR